MRVAVGIVALAVLAGCGGGLRAPADSPFAPYGAPAFAEGADQLQVAYTLMDAGEHELALRAFTRAAADKGLTPEIMGGMGAANLGLGRLGQAEGLLRQALEVRPEATGTMNNLGVVMMERGDTAEAATLFRRAFALDNGTSPEIRENLALALAKLEDQAYTSTQEGGFQVIRGGSSTYRIAQAP
ncbi:MAG: tetratricopeptide repeat protein [Shimia sp.]